jgi:putative transposase
MEPTELEALKLERTASMARYVYNWALAGSQEYYQQHGRYKPWAELSAELTQLKHIESWLYDFDSQMLQQALADLRRAYINFFERRAKFPKFKEKRAAKPSFRIPQRVRIENGCVYIPSIGRVRIRQSQANEFATKSATFKRTAVRHWFVTLVADRRSCAPNTDIRTTTFRSPTGSGPVPAVEPTTSGTGTPPKTCGRKVSGSSSRDTRRR